MKSTQHYKIKPERTAVFSGLNYLHNTREVYFLLFSIIIDDTIAYTIVIIPIPITK